MIQNTPTIHKYISRHPILLRKKTNEYKQKCYYILDFHNSYFIYFVYCVYCVSTCYVSSPGLSATSYFVSPERTAARELVGSRLNADHAEKAARIIIMLKPFMDGKRTPFPDELWGFFDMERPHKPRLDADDPIIKTLRGKLNRQRLLLHPDKNAHPDAEQSFKYLENSFARLQDVCVRRDRNKIPYCNCSVPTC